MTGKTSLITGYHLYGEQPKWVDELSMYSLPVRPSRDRGISREVAYKDLYFVEQVDVYVCCCGGCGIKVKMHVDKHKSKGSNVYVAFSNFYDHLTIYHPEYLHLDDIDKDRFVKKFVHNKKAGNLITRFMISPTPINAEEPMKKNL